MSRMKILSLGASIIIAVVSQPVFSQGCSDAGFCSMQFYPNKEKENQYKNAITLGNIAAIGEENTFINNNYISYHRYFSNKINIEAKITSSYINGKLADVFSAGDVYTKVAYTLYNNEEKGIALTVIAGAKIPLNFSNLQAGNKPLPMVYQTSLGTIDAIVGLQLKYKNLEITNSYQIPVANANKNSFISQYSIAKEFPSTNFFRRNSDVLLSVAYTFYLKNKMFYITPRVLNILHTGNDSFENILGQRETIFNSIGLTVNANVKLGYNLNARSRFELSLATPLAVRKVRPDGLTRKFTAEISYLYNF